MEMEVGELFETLPEKDQDLILDLFAHYERCNDRFRFDDRMQARYKYLGAGASRAAYKISDLLVCKVLVSRGNENANFLRQSTTEWNLWKKHETSKVADALCPILAVAGRSIKTAHKKELFVEVTIQFLVDKSSEWYDDYNTFYSSQYNNPSFPRGLLCDLRDANVGKLGHQVVMIDYGLDVEW